MTRDWSGLKYSLYSTSILIAALIVMPFIAGFERARDWLGGRSR